MKASALLARVLPRLSKLPDGSGVSFIDALNIAVDVFFERMHRKRSEIVKAMFDDFDVAEEVVDLPVTFRGLVSARLSLVSGSTTLHIAELPADVEAPTTGDPAYFSLLGAKQMQFYPAPTSAYTLEGGYYAHPGTLTMSSTIPWGGLFDRALADAVVIAAVTGSLDDSQAEKMIDGVLAARTVSPRRNKLW